MKYVVVAIAYLGAILLAFWALPVAAQICSSRAEVVRILAKKYGERPRAVGMAVGGGVVEIFTSSNGSWSILSTSAYGQSCVISVGRAFELVPQNFDPES